MQAGPYSYRVLRPAYPLTGAVLTRAGELRVPRRTALRMLALAELAGDRTLVAFPLRDPAGIPYDLVLADESLRFPAERWSDIRQRLGAGHPERHLPQALAAGPPPRRAPQPRPAATRHALIVPLDAHRTDLARLRRGELDLGHLRVSLTG
ncbi:hypothetical protein [Dactylosporangium sp. CA-092794]|uniref:hypothetical protein n=1 Tax=Dactylosporangium sp. CA-092794 TaxID=3239929 RepID=UPI003D8F0B1F